MSIIVEHSQITIPFSIANGQTTSGAVRLAGQTVVGLVIPALNGTPTLNAQVSYDGSGWHNLLKADGASQAIAITGGASGFAVGLDELTRLAPFPYFRLVASITQTADRQFEAICKG